MFDGIIELIQGEQTADEMTSHYIYSVYSSVGLLLTLISTCSRRRSGKLAELLCSRLIVRVLVNLEHFKRWEYFGRDQRLLSGPPNVDETIDSPKQNPLMSKQQS